MNCPTCAGRIGIDCDGHRDERDLELAEAWEWEERLAEADASLPPASVERGDE